MENNFKSNLQHELKDFQSTLMLAVEKMITTKMKAPTIAMKQSFQAIVAQVMTQFFQNNNAIELIPITQPEYNSQTSNATDNHAQLYNTNRTNKASLISPTNVKGIT